MQQSLLVVLVAAAAFGFGIFIFLNPERTFEIQKKFYAMINWRIEPICLTKEVRNTKLMGIFLMVFVIISSLYYFLREGVQ